MIQTLFRWSPLSLTLIALVLTQGCGHRRTSDDSESLWAQSDQLTDAGLYLCKQSFSYGNPKTQDFLLSAGENRRTQKSAVSTQCRQLQSSQDPAGTACASKGAAANVRCVAEKLIAPNVIPQGNQKVRCILPYTYSERGVEFEDYKDLLEVSGRDKKSAIAALFRLCQGRTGTTLEKDQVNGCSEAILLGKTQCSLQ